MPRILSNGVPDPLRLSAGSAAAPTYSFSGDPNTGVYSGGADILAVTTGGTARWLFNASGHLIAANTNTNDIGTSATVAAPRTVYAGTSFVVAAAGGYFWSGVGSLTMPVSGGLQINDASAANTVRMTAGAANLLTLNGGLTIANNLSLSAGNQILFGANARIVDSASGNLLVSTSGMGTGFNLLQFGGTTSSFPALKRSGVQLELRLADDSAFTALKVSVLKTDAVTVATLPSAASAGAGGRSFVTDALGPTFGAAVVGGGAVKVPVYSDGSAWLVG